MAQDALNSFARFDADMALSVVKEDRAVDKEYINANQELTVYMTENLSFISGILTLMWVLRSLERIGDHAGNIAEYVIYLVKGTDVRHLGFKRIQQEIF